MLLEKIEQSSDIKKLKAEEFLWNLRIGKDFFKDSESINYKTKRLMNLTISKLVFW